MLDPAMSVNYTLPLAKPPTHFQVLPASGRTDSQQSFAAIYIHIPFCSFKCHYCDFFSVAGHLDQAPAYLDALAIELQLQTRHFGRPSPETIFIGGGTPTLLEPLLLKRLMDMLREYLDFSRVEEFTIESNPNTFDIPRANVLKNAGVNRISFGAQSFVPADLTILQRDHDPKSVARAAGIAAQVGIDNINIDLIFAIPGQTLDSWDYSLGQALALRPQHLSCYALMYEPNTPLTARLKAGQIQSAPESLEIDLIHHTQKKLTDAGFIRYEISNYALPDRECRHNLHYWRGANHLALGASAWGHLDGIRWKNVAGINRYTGALLGDFPCVPIVEMEQLSDLKRWGELAILHLRLRQGLNWRKFEKITGVDVRRRLFDVLRKYEGMGYLFIDEEQLALTDQAVIVSDTILADVLAAFG